MDRPGGLSYLAMEMMVEASATPPTLTSKDSSPAGTSGIRMFICSRPTKTRGEAGELNGGDDSANLDLHRGDGQGEGTRRRDVAGGDRGIDQSLAGEIGGDILSGPRREFARN